VIMPIRQFQAHRMQAPRHFKAIENTPICVEIGAGKGKDSVSQGIQYMQSYHFVVHPRVKGLLEEFNTYVYSKDKFDNWTNTPVDANNHGIDGLRYALEPFMFRTAGQYMSNQERIQTIKNIGLG
jgi:phage terminase large subunit